MVQATCGCLNVKINTKNDNLFPTIPADLGIDTDEYEDDAFFREELCDVRLPEKNISKEFPEVIKTKKVGEWVIHKCINCEMKTHAISIKQPTRVLINCSLRSEPTDIKRLEQSENYSPVYKIVLSNHNKNKDLQPPIGAGLRSGRYTALQEVLSDIRLKLDHHLEKEESDMEERIRKFEKEQKKAFLATKDKAVRHKNDLIGLILSVEEQEIKTSMSEAIDESPISPMSMDDTEVSLSSSGSDRRRGAATINKNIRPRTVSRPKSPDSDGIFALDGFEDYDVQVHESESDDENDTDDSGMSSDTSSKGFNRSVNQGLLSSSVPISMPQMSLPIRRNVDFDEEDEKPDDIAASIKALAQSVHEDSRVIFGDRPRSKKVSVTDIVRR